MNTCESCRHWTESERENYEPEGLRQGKCNCEAFVYTGDCGYTPINGLGYWDYEGYLAYFSTGPAFGCIHWEADDE